MKEKIKDAKVSVPSSRIVHCGKLKDNIWGEYDLKGKITLDMHKLCNKNEGTAATLIHEVGHWLADKVLKGKKFSNWLESKGGKGSWTIDASAEPDRAWGEGVWLERIFFGDEYTQRVVHKDSRKIELTPKTR